MRNIIYFITMILIFSNGLVSSAKRNSPLGIGIKFPTIQEYNYPAVLIPLDIMEGLVIEPLFWLYSYDIDDYDIEGLEIRIGMGVFLKKKYDKHNIYFGGRISHFSKSEEIDNEQQYEDGRGVENHSEIGVGVESNINDNFSISGELFYSTFKSKEPEITIKIINPQLVLRFYP